MNRREFSGFVAGAAVSALLPSSLFAELTTGVSPMAAELYARALVLDCNSGPPYEDGRLPLPQADLELVRNTGVSVVKLSLGGINRAWRRLSARLPIIQQMIEVHPANFMQVRVPGDLERAKRKVLESFFRSRAPRCSKVSPKILSCFAISARA
jgi:membrane dipeptidase